MDTYNLNGYVNGLKSNTDLKKQIIHLSGMVARKKQKVLGGKPVIHSSTNDEIKKEMETIADEIFLPSVLFSMIKENSIYGDCVIAPSINPDDNSAGAAIQERQFTYKVARYNNRVIYALVWRTITFNRVEYRIREVWDAEKVERSFIGQGNQFIKAESFNAKLPKGFELPEVEYHNLGIVPIVQSFNYPTLNFTNPIEVSDLFYGRNLQRELDETTFALAREKRNNITRIMLDQGYLDGLDEQNQLKAADSDIFIGLDGTDSKEGSLPLTILQGNPKLTEYWKAIERNLTLASKASGVNIGIEEQGDGTATGTILAKGDEIETINSQIISLQKYVRELMIKLYHMKKGISLTWAELEQFDYEVSITPNIATDEIKKTDMVIAQLENGLISRVKGKMMIDGVDQELAEEEIKLADEDGYYAEKQDEENVSEEGTPDNLLDKVSEE